MNRERGKERMASMSDYMYATIKALRVIHDENMLILSALVDRDMNNPMKKEMNDVFDKAIEGILKQK